MLRPYDAGMGTEHSVLVDVLMYNSITLTIGDVVAVMGTGYANVGAAAAPLFGVVTGFVDMYGKPITPTGYVAGTATYTTVDSATSSASNTTDKTYYVRIETSPFKRWSAKVNGTLGSTGSSTLPGCGIDIDSAGSSYGQVLESTATRTAGTCTNFYSWGEDPSDTTRLIVSIRSSEMIGESS